MVKASEVFGGGGTDTRDLDQYTYATGTASTDMVTAAANTDGIFIRHAQILASFGGGAIEIFYDTDGAGTGKKSIVKLHVGRDGVGHSVGGVVVENLHVPAGTYLRVSRGIGEFLIYYEVL